MTAAGVVILVAFAAVLVTVATCWLDGRWRDRDDGGDR